MREIVDILALFAHFTPIVLIVAGIFSALWFLERLTDVISKDITRIVKFIKIFGAFVGCIALIYAGIDLILPQWSEINPPSYDILTVVLLFLVGLSLCLGPIKDIPWAALATWGVGLGLFAIIGLVFGKDALLSWISVIIIVFLIIFYLMMKFMLETYVLVAKSLTSPLFAVPLGAICIIQGLLIFVSSEWSLLTLIVP